MTEMFFNVLLDYNSIVRCYRNKEFPNAHCLLWNKELHNALATEKTEFIITEMTRKVVEVDGSTELPIY